MICLLAACDRFIDVGTDIVWSTDNETGLAAWAASPGGGGSYRVAGNPTLATSAEHAHSGLVSVKITSATTNALPAPYLPGGAALYKFGEFPTNAYYSAWYFVPRAVAGAMNWNIIRVGYPAIADAGTPIFPTRAPGASSSGDAGTAAAGDAGAAVTNFAELFDVRLRYQPSGDTTLVLFDHRQAYREESMPSPVPVVPIGQWFQIEFFYRNVADASGHLTIWLDGARVYDVSRPMSGDPLVYFATGSLVEDGVSVELFLDDVAVSWTRVTPRGTLRL